MTCLLGRTVEWKGGQKGNGPGAGAEEEVYLATQLCLDFDKIYYICVVVWTSTKFITFMLEAFTEKGPIGNGFAQHNLRVLNHARAFSHTAHANIRSGAAPAVLRFTQLLTAF